MSLQETLKSSTVLFQSKQCHRFLQFSIFIVCGSWTHGCPTPGSADAVKQQEPMWNLSQLVSNTSLLSYIIVILLLCQRKPACLLRQIIYQIFRILTTLPLVNAREVNLNHQIMWYLDNSHLKGTLQLFPFSQFIFPPNTCT